MNRDDWKAILGGALFALLLLCSVAVAADSAWYCRVLSQFERSCAGVKAATATFGPRRAETLARRCGASDAELAEARACIAPARACPPEWKCTPKGNWNDPDCRRPDCAH